MSPRPNAAFDPITLEVLWSRLISIVDEAAATFRRSSFSTLVRDANDYAVVLMDADLSHHPKFIPEMYRCVSVHFHSFRVDCSLLAWVAEAWGGPADWC